MCVYTHEIGAHTLVCIQVPCSTMHLCSWHYTDIFLLCLDRKCVWQTVMLRDISVTGQTCQRALMKVSKQICHRRTAHTAGHPWVPFSIHSCSCPKTHGWRAEGQRRRTHSTSHNILGWCSSQLSVGTLKPLGKLHLYCKYILVNLW